MNFLKLLILFFIFPILTYSQFFDDFSDGDFITNPSWSGDISQFEVDSNYSLHLNDTIASTSYLSVSSDFFYNTSWEFNVRLDFSPSTNNYAKVYIASDTEDLSAPLNGVFVKIGGQTGSIDEVSLYNQVGTNSNKIIDGIDGLATNNPEFKIKVTRNLLGDWELFVDTNGVYFSQGTVFDTTIDKSLFMGVYCRYTITRSDKFWFDDFIINGSPTTIFNHIFKNNEINIPFDLVGRNTNPIRKNNFSLYFKKSGNIEKRYILE